MNAPDGGAIEVIVWAPYPFDGFSNGGGSFAPLLDVGPERQPGGGGGGRGVHLRWGRTFKCNKGAGDVIKAIASGFSKFGNFTGSFGLGNIDVAHVTFGNVPVTQGAIIPITDVNTLGPTINTSVTVTSVSATSFTFVTNSGHVLYPATIAFSASNAANGMINFSINVNGDFASRFDKVLYYAGGEDLENKIWNNFIDDVQKFCASKTN